jgi:hypothetical protein
MSDHFLGIDLGTSSPASDMSRVKTAAASWAIASAFSTDSPWVTQPGIAGT